MPDGIYNVTKDRLGPCQGSNERKVTGAGMGSGCGVQRRRRRLAVVRLPIRVQCRFGLETLGCKPRDTNDMQQNQNQNIYYKYPSKSKKRLHMN